MSLPTDAKARKAVPVWSGCIAYFPDALVAIAMLSQSANEQHNPGEPLHWAKEKSTDEEDAGMRHGIEPLLIGGSPYDSDGYAHKVKKAWRALADLQRFLEAGNPARAPLTPTGQGAQCEAEPPLWDDPVPCAECGRNLRLSAIHAPNCSHNFQRPAIAVPDETLYATKPAGDPAPGLDSAQAVAPVAHCIMCGCEAPRHHADCLSRAANGGI